MKTKMTYTAAYGMALRLVGELASTVQRIEVAGSLRRQCPEVGDIEIVCIPNRDAGLFGEPMDTFSALERRMSIYRKIKGDLKYRQYQIVDDITLDLFLCTRETWGVNYTLRTGCADFSHWLVTSRRDGGGKPSHLAVRDGRIWQGETPLDTPEERDVFDALGVRWIEPPQRTAGLWKR